jgi:hypothetical protein
MAPARVFALILGLAASAAAVLAFGASPGHPSGRGERVREFHRLVGGLGFGPSVDLARCEFGFDPRLCPACSDDCGPVPGGMFFCPRHAGSVLAYPPLPALGALGER